MKSISSLFFLFSVGQFYIFVNFPTFIFRSRFLPPAAPISIHIFTVERGAYYHVGGREGYVVVGNL